MLVKLSCMCENCEETLYTEVILFSDDTTAIPVEIAAQQEFQCEDCEMTTYTGELDKMCE